MTINICTVKICIFQTGLCSFTLTSHAKFHIRVWVFVTSFTFGLVGVNARTPKLWSTDPFHA